MSKKKTKKEKITYIDDGRTIADMSGLDDRMRWAKRGTSSHWKDIWHTYWSAVKMMVAPMLVVIGFLALAYLIMWLLFWLM